jgi:steroid delta-isomerase
MNLKEISWKEVLKDITQKKETSNIPTGTPTPEHMRKAMQSYIDIINKNYHEGTLNLFADNYTLEDPFGTKAVTISSENREKDLEDKDVKFIPKKAELIAPISTTYGNQAAMAFKLWMDVGGQEVTIDIIDVMTFDESGKIIKVVAHWSRDNVSLINRGNDSKE